MAHSLLSELIHIYEPMCTFFFIYIHGFMGNTIVLDFIRWLLYCYFNVTWRYILCTWKVNDWFDKRFELLMKMSDVTDGVAPIYSSNLKRYTISKTGDLNAISIRGLMYRQKKNIYILHTSWSQKLRWPIMCRPQMFILKKIYILPNVGKNLHIAYWLKPESTDHGPVLNSRILNP